MTGNKTLIALRELLDIMTTLRSDHGCRWDRQQTPESLKPYLLEECYELLEAIDRAQPQEICDELGDLLLQVVFQAQIFSEQGLFSMADVAASISRKLIRRHPHIFARADAEGHEQRWEEIKLRERQERGLPLSLAERIPKTLPALKRAQKIAKRIDSIDSYKLIPKIELKLNQLKSLAVELPSATDQRQKILAELLFCISHLSYTLDIDAEESLRQFNVEIVTKIDANK